MRFENNEIHFDHLLTRMEGSTLVVTFNRPEVRNAINWTMERELYTALYVADRFESVKAVVLNGAGEIFSAGHDLKQVRDEAGNMPMVDGEMWARQSTMLPTWNFKKPFIVAAHNFVGPFANGILLTADFIIASKGTRFSFEHARTSVGRPWGPYPLMFFHFPPRVIYKLWAMGGWMDADQALQLNYVQRVVDRSELDEVALKWAEQVSIVDSEGFQQTKQGVHEMIEAMGLLEMVEVGRQPMGGRSSDAMAKGEAFNEVWSKEGVKAALALRDAGVDPEITRV